MQTKKINIHGEEISYFDNQKEKTTLIFIHGALINKEYWTEQLSYFSKTYRTIAIDLPGHGKSSWKQKEVTVRKFGKLVSGFIETLSLKNAILIGHSFGSDIMLEAVAINDSNIIGLVEIDHMKNVGVALPKEVVDQLILGLKTDFQRTCEQFAEQALLTDKTSAKLVSKILRDYERMNPEVAIPLLANSFNYADREAELLKSLKFRLYSIHVNYSRTNEESLKKIMGNNCELYTINGTCHYPMLENAEKFNTLLDRIIAKIQKYS